ncbi:hypothetical protein D3C72_1882360 [compost metagenome]
MHGAGAGLQGLDAFADQLRLLADQLEQRLGVGRIAEAVVGIDVAAHAQQPGGQLGQQVIGDGGDGNELAGGGAGAEDQRGLARQAEKAPAAQGTALG